MNYTTHILIIIVLLSTLFSFQSCKTPASIQSADLDQLEKVIIMKKEPCFGRCPVYELTVYENGIIAYDGKRFCNKEGLHLKKMNKAKFEKLLIEFRAAELWGYKEFYPARIPDLQTVTIVYNQDGKRKSITGKDGRPEEVTNLEDMLTAIADSDGWTSKDGEEIGTRTTNTSQAGKYIMVQLEESQDINVWIRQFIKQEMKVVRNVKKDFWMVSFNKDIISAEDLLKFVKKDQFVKSAEIYSPNAF